MERRKEKWLAFDLSQQLHDRAKRAATDHGISLRDFCVSAIEEALNACNLSVELATRATQEERCEDLSRFVEPARDEIILLGTTLGCLASQKGRELLRERLKAGVRLSVMLFYPPHVEDTSARRALVGTVAQRRRCSEAQLLEDIRQVLVLLGQLKSEMPDSVEVVGLDNAPTMGMVIFDANVPGSKMRVSLYADQYLREFEPALILSYSGNGDSLMVYGALYKHCLDLRRTNREIDLERAEKELDALKEQLRGISARPAAAELAETAHAS